MATVHFITHPEVLIDPAQAVTDWALSDVGIVRTRAMLGQPWVTGLRSVFCSAERKAREAADLLGAHLGVVPVVMAALGENDRSATGYLPRVAFEAMADAFFARPDESVRGWERAVDAQARIVGAVAGVLAAAPAGDVAIVSHGGVGALLLCRLKGVAISRAEDQPGGGGGNRFVFDRATLALVSGWRAIDGSAGAEPHA